MCPARRSRPCAPLPKKVTRARGPTTFTVAGEPVRKRSWAATRRVQQPQADPALAAREDQPACHAHPGRCPDEHARRPVPRVDKRDPHRPRRAEVVPGEDDATVRERCGRPHRPRRRLLHHRRPPQRRVTEPRASGGRLRPRARRRRTRRAADRTVRPPGPAVCIVTRRSLPSPLVTVPAVIPSSTTVRARAAWSTTATVAGPMRRPARAAAPASPRCAPRTRGRRPPRRCRRLRVCSGRPSKRSSSRFPLPRRERDRAPTPSPSPADAPRPGSSCPRPRRRAGRRSESPSARRLAGHRPLPRAACDRGSRSTTARSGPAGSTDPQGATWSGRTVSGRFPARRSAGRRHG